jgi:hypothetical protein
LNPRRDDDDIPEASLPAAFNHFQDKPLVHREDDEVCVHGEVLHIWETEKPLHVKVSGVHRVDRSLIPTSHDIA